MSLTRIICGRCGQLRIYCICPAVAIQQKDSPTNPDIGPRETKPVVSDETANCSTQDIDPALIEACAKACQHARYEYDGWKWLATAVLTEAVKRGAVMPDEVDNYFCEHVNDVARLRREIAALTAERDAARKGLYEAKDSLTYWRDHSTLQRIEGENLRCDLLKAEAENARLRKALERIVNGKLNGITEQERFVELTEIARDALEGEGFTADKTDSFYVPHLCGLGIKPCPACDALGEK